MGLSLINIVLCREMCVMLIYIYNRIGLFSQLLDIDNCFHRLSSSSIITSYYYQ